MHGAASLCTWCAPTRGFSCGRPAGVSVVGPQSADLGAPNLASGEGLGCLSSVHSPGAEGGGAPEPGAAAESSLISHWVPLIFFFFLRNSSYSSPPGLNKHLAPHTAQPGSLPRILQHTLCPGWGFSHPGPHAGSGDLIVLKHSSYHQIF